VTDNKLKVEEELYLIALRARNKKRFAESFHHVGKNF
jgi:hypothetical protein